MPTRRSLSNNRNPSKKQTANPTWSPFLHPPWTVVGVPGVLDAGEPFRRPTHGQRGHQLRLAHPRRRATATEAGLDLPQNHTAVSDEDNIDEITQWMISRYKTLRGDLNAIDDPEERYKALGKDAKASVALRNIATYFVRSNRTGYPVEQHRNHHRGNIGPCRSGTAVRRAIRLRRHPRRLQRHSTATLRSPATNSSPSWARSSAAGRKPA